MNTKLIYQFLIAVFLLIPFSVSSQNTVQKGYIDLHDFNFDSTVINLSGVWEFYPNQFYLEKDLEKKHIENVLFLNVPSLWKKSVFPNKQNPEIGFGTYKINVRFPEKKDIYALRLKRIESAYSIYINDSLTVSTGIVGKDVTQTKPSQNTISKTFSANGPTSLIIHISNFHHRKGGIDDEIILGKPDKINSVNRSAQSYEFFIFGVLIIMAVFHLGLFFFGKKDFSFLFFSFLLISQILSTSVNGEMFIMKVFPELSWQWLKKIDYLSNFLRLTFFVLFFRHLYKEYIHLYFSRTIIGSVVVLSGIVFFTDISFYSFTLFVFISLFLISLSYILYAQIKSIRSKKEGAIIPFSGTIILSITAVNDIFYVFDIIDSIYLIPFGLFIFIFTQSYILSFSFSNLYKKAEELNRLTKDLDEMKNKLLNDKSLDLNKTLKTLCAYNEADKAYIFTVKETVPDLKAYYPEDTELLIEKYLSEIVKESILNKSSIIIQNLGLSSFKQHFKSDHNNVKSILAVPLIVSDKLRAVICFESEKKSKFNSRHRDFYQNMSDQILGISDNIKMFNELEGLKKNLKNIIYKRTTDRRNQQSLLIEQKDEILAINNELKETLKELSSKNKVITDNIHIAELTQKALLPEEKTLLSLFPNLYILYKPKDILSGDFFWGRQIQNESGSVISVFSLIDCTGHGVPGAMMSLISNNLLNSAVLTNNLYHPGDILNHIQKEFYTNMYKNDEEAAIKDGMDIAVISYDKQKNELMFAGAKQNMFIFRNKEYAEIKGDRKSVGIGRYNKQDNEGFTEHTIKLKDGDTIYLYTDGYVDQFGGQNNQRFMKKNFTELLKRVNELSFNIQRSHLLKNLNQWQGRTPQNDDISVVGIQFK